MPRLPPSLFWKARQLSPQGPVLLPVCRDLVSTANELRWIREHIAASRSVIPPGLRFWQLCEARGRGVPLQYVLGTQPFGELEILCRPGVLIPRAETEASTIKLAAQLASHAAHLHRQGAPVPPLRILDLCTGTGCIPLLLYARLRGVFPSLRVYGVDISPRAVSLARANLRRAVRTGTATGADRAVSFSVGDIFDLDTIGTGTWDVLVSNPPYISADGFARATGRSVRNYEPRLALVPEPELQGHVRYRCRPEDVFYERLLYFMEAFKPRAVLFEVADMAQAVRVASLMETRRFVCGDRQSGGWKVEIWRDNPDDSSTNDRGLDQVEELGEDIPVRGTGDGRCVYAYRAE